MSTNHYALLALWGAAAIGLVWLALAAPGSNQEYTEAMVSETGVDNGFVVLPTAVSSKGSPTATPPAVTPSAAVTGTAPAPVEHVQPIMDPYAG